MKVLNRKAHYNYEIIEKFEAGLVLTGAEVKHFRKGQVSLQSAHAKIIAGEIFLVGMVLDTDRSRKLLMHKKQIVALESKIKQKKLTIIPLSVYTRARLVKVELALARAKRKFEKKELIKKKDIDRDIKNF